MRRAVLCCLPLLLGLLASCSIQQRYPGAWPRVDPTRVAGCPDVTGVYLNDGVRGDPFGALVSLSDLLQLGSTSESILRISQYGADSLAIVVWRDDRQVARRMLSRSQGNLTCTPAGVGLTCGWHFVGREGLELGAARRTLYLAKATDGSLMVQDVEFTVGVLIVLPIIGTMRSWHRFSPTTIPPLPPAQGESPPIE
jgi:hypothetical protein